MLAEEAPKVNGMTSDQFEYVLKKITEVLNKITRDLVLAFKILWKYQIWPNKQNIKAHWYKIYSNNSSHYSREETTTEFIQVKEVRSTKFLYKLQLNK